MAGGGTMNQPLMVYRPSGVNGTGGFFAGTYDYPGDQSPYGAAAMRAALEVYAASWVQYRMQQLDGQTVNPPTPPGILTNASFLFTSWYRNQTSGGRVYLQGLATSRQYPWLMNYLRVNDVRGGYGGYPWQGAGGMFGPVRGHTR